MDIEELLNQNELHMEQVLRCSLDELPFSPYTLRALKAKNIYTLKDLTSRTRDDILAIPFLGMKGYLDIKKVLDEYDLKLK